MDEVHMKKMGEAKMMMEKSKDMAEMACKMMDEMMGKGHKEDMPKGEMKKGHYKT